MHRFNNTSPPVASSFTNIHHFIIMNTMIVSCCPDHVQEIVWLLMGSLCQAVRSPWFPSLKCSVILTLSDIWKKIPEQSPLLSLRSLRGELLLLSLLLFMAVANEELLRHSWRTAVFQPLTVCFWNVKKQLQDVVVNRSDIFGWYRCCQLSEWFMQTWCRYVRTVSHIKKYIYFLKKLNK